MKETARAEGLCSFDNSDEFLKEDVLREKDFLNDRSFKESLPRRRTWQMECLAAEIKNFRNV